MHTIKHNIVIQKSYVKSTRTLHQNAFTFNFDFDFEINFIGLDEAWKLFIELFTQFWYEGRQANQRYEQEQDAMESEH